jgi:hypothetical protein
MSPKRHNLKIVTSGQPEAFTFQGLRFSPADPIGLDGHACNPIEDCVYTWTPAQGCDELLPANLAGGDKSR